MDKKALIIIDVQECMFNHPKYTIYKGDNMLLNIQKLIEKARQAEVPIVYIQYTLEKENSGFSIGSEGWQIYHLVAPKPNDIVLHIYTPDPFVKTNLEKILQEKEINQLVICGLQTEYSIDTTCRRAFSLGYKNYLVKDANSTFDVQPLTAVQIIEHHHRIMADWFATVVLTDEFEF